MILGLLDGVEVVAAAGDGEQALALVDQHHPDVVLMDLRMPRVDGTEATSRLHTTHPELPVVVLTTYADDESIFSALRAGARGYLTKNASAAEIAHALRTVHAGHALLDPAVQARLLENMSTPADAAPPPGSRPLPDELTPREAEVLTLIAAGHSNAQIAEQLYLSPATVKSHINHIFTKTRVRDRAQAVTYAYQHGLAQSQDRN
ncbi:MAG: response regulator [Solirubrobacteraceae bacterium]